jgi:NIMA (never in mitosis gene a)-related kinase
MEKYAFGDVIGHGNYGTCHIVTHKKENRHYVAKRIPVHDVAARGEALAEAQLLSKIKHPNVIAYKESFLSSPDDDDDDDDVDVKRDGNRKSANRRRRLRGGDCLCIVTAYAEEGDLFTHIKRARESNPRRYFPERQVLDWTAQIALALDHIHAMRVMHRDLKTQNIFLGRGGVVKLGDFGISRVLERTDDFATTVAGTPYYLSPEVCQNQPYTLKSDVWSFGCVAYEIATLEHAFAADSLLSLVYQIVNGTCDYKEISDRYDERFVGLIQAMLRRDSAKRPSVASVLRSEIMQDHLRRMQRDGLGRPRSAIVAPPPRPLIVPRDRVTSSHGNQKKGGAHQTDGSTSYATPTTNTPRVASNAQGKVGMTPKEAMAERRRKAAEARSAVLLAAATEQSNVAKEAFRREFHGPGSVTCSDVSSATSADEARDGNNAGSGSIPPGNGDERASRDFARRAYEEKRGDEEKVAFDSRGEAIEAVATEAVAGGSGTRGWEDEVAEYALQETGGSFGLRSLGLGEVVDSLEGLNVGDEGDSRNEAEPSDPAPTASVAAEPFAHTTGFVPPADSYASVDRVVV